LGGTETTGNIFASIAATPTRYRKYFFRTELDKWLFCSHLSSSVQKKKSQQRVTKGAMLA